MKYSKDGLVSFDEKTHSYYMGDKKLMGVTSYISKFKNKFDSDLMAEKYSKKHGLKKEDVLNEWKLKSEKSIETGKRCHYLLENYAITKKIEFIENCEKEKSAAKFINDFFESNILEIISVEDIVYNTELASQIDCIVRNKKGEYFIIDWKTSNKIDTNSYGKQMLDKYSFLPDCSFYHYSLQLALYRSMHKEFHVKKCYIIHLKNDSYNTIESFNINI